MNFSPEQMQEMRQRFENMSDEDRQRMNQMRRQFENMSDEDRQQMMERYRGGGGGFGPGGRGGRSMGGPEQEQQ